MRTRRSLFGLSLLSLVAACETPRPLASTADAAPSTRDAATSATSAANAVNADASLDDDLLGDAAVRARPVARAATSDTWNTVASLAPLGSRAALDAHLRAVAQHRTQEQARIREIHRRRQEEQRREWAARLADAGAAGAADDEFAARGASGIGFGGLGVQSASASAERRGGAAPAARARPAQAQSTTATASSNSITNNQVANVDEGDIVKASGDDLIILRRGHLFRVSTANNTVRRVGHAPAYAPGTRPGDWYDELLVDGDIALVLGYSYSAEATEVNRFKLERGGAIRYLDSFYLRSDDYFSSDNYATRLVNGRFVMYVPMELGDRGADIRMPSVRLGRAGAFRSVLEFSSVFATEGDRQSSTLHAVLTCDVHSAAVSCSARGVLGASSRTFYVSNSAVYVWTTSEQASLPEADRQGGASWIVRMPHASEQRAGAAQIRGGPVDQFAFDERDGALHVLLRDDSQGDGMWSRDAAMGAISAVKLPLSRLDGAVIDAPVEAYTSLVSAPAYGSFKERWVGDYAVFSTSESTYRYRGWARPTQPSRPRLFAYRARDQRLFELHTDHAIERIEPLGAHALVVGSHGGSLELAPIALDAALPEPYAPLRLPNRAQGESRSHGFFFNPSGPRAGVFGIATTGGSSDERSGMGSSDVSFFRMENLALSSIGTVSAHPSRDNRCSTSCYDWYGNTRPIFWGDRVFALMGDEIVEAALRERSLTERNRVDYGRGVRGVVEDE